MAGRSPHVGVPIRLLGAAFLVACTLPSDESDGLLVVLEASSPILIRGQLLRLQASVQHAGDGKVVPGGAFVWSSSDTNIARVTRGPGGTATVVGVNSGRAIIGAFPEDFQSASPGELNLRVANPVEIDSVTPSSVQYGEQVVLHGVGLGGIARATLGEVTLIPDSSSFTGEAAGTGTVRFWIPYPATSGRVLVVPLEGGGAPAPLPTTVVPVDVYDAERSDATVLAVGTVPVADDGTLFSNPALVIASAADVDNYRIQSDGWDGPLSVIVSTAVPGVTGLDPILSPDRPPDLPIVPSPDSWTITADSQFCKRDLVDLAQAPPPGRERTTFVRSFVRPPADPLLLQVRGASAGRYGLSIVNRYLTADPRLEADRLEDNDTCVDADRWFSDASTRVFIDSTSGFSEILSIDNPYDVDWLRFQVRDNIRQLVTIRLASRPFGAADSSDLGLLLGPIPQPFEPDPVFEWTIRSHSAQSGETVGVELEPGDYYLAIVDDAGVATRYALCMALGASCPLVE
jgi:hypothetical protein